MKKQRKLKRAKKWQKRAKMWESKLKFEFK